MSQYNSGTEQQHASCLPPEAYIQMWRTAKEGPPPRFMSSVYPPKKPVMLIKKKQAKKDKIVLSL